MSLPQSSSILCSETVRLGCSSPVLITLVHPPPPPLTLRIGRFATTKRSPSDPVQSFPHPATLLPHWSATPQLPSLSGNSHKPSILPCRANHIPLSTLISTGSSAAPIFFFFFFFFFFFLLFPVSAYGHTYRTPNIPFFSLSVRRPRLGIRSAQRSVLSLRLVRTSLSPTMRHPWLFFDPTLHSRSRLTRSHTHMPFASNGPTTAAHDPLAQSTNPQNTKPTCQTHISNSDSDRSLLSARACLGLLKLQPLHSCPDLSLHSQSCALTDWQALDRAWTVVERHSSAWA